MPESRQRPDTSRLPWFPLYTDDWKNDLELSTCSLAAQGLLVRLMCEAWPTGGVTCLKRRGLYGLCGATTRAEVDKAFAELIEAERISVEDDGATLTVTIARLTEEARRAELLRDKRVEKAKRAADVRWSSMPQACSGDATGMLEHATETIDIGHKTREQTHTCLSRISNTIAADDEPETPTTSQPEVSDVEVNGLESLLTQSFSGWMDLLQKTGRPHKIIMATPSQRRWWFTLKDIGSQMIGQWPTTAQGARDGLQRLIDVVAAKPDVLKRYINAPHFLKSDWPQMVEAVTPVKVWTDHDEQKAQAAIKAMMERRDKICRLASQE